MMMSCAGSRSSVIYQPLSSLPTTHPRFHLEKKKRESRVFFKISPLAFSIPPLNANANVNTNTLIKNMWEENANLLFCNPPEGARCYTETNTKLKKTLSILYETQAHPSLIVFLSVFFPETTLKSFTLKCPRRRYVSPLLLPFLMTGVNQTMIIRAAR